MNKKTIIISTLFFTTLLCIIIFSVIKMTFAGDNANQPSIVIECDNSSINPNTSTTCYIRGKNFNYGVASIEANLNVGNNLTLTSVEKNSSWEQGSINNNGRILLYSATNKHDNFEIASFVVKADNINDDGANTNLSLTNVVISNGEDNFKEMSMTESAINIRIKSNINSLSSLNVNSNNILTNETTYYLTIENEEYVIINATCTSNSSILSGDIGTKKINYGLNTFNIKVTSESGIDNVYTIYITKPEFLTFSENVIIKTIDNDSFFEKNTTDNSFNTYNKIKNEITTSGKITIKNKSGIELSSDDKIGTGDKLLISLSNKTNNYYIIIKGDVNGDGNVSLADVAKSFQHVAKTKIISQTNLYYLLAGDVVKDKDDEIKLNDVAKLFQYVSGTYPTLN